MIGGVRSLRKQRGLESRTQMEGLISLGKEDGHLFLCNGREQRMDRRSCRARSLLTVSVLLSFGVFYNLLWSLAQNKFL